jgi:uncharacterized protein YozE (UPF0346 family)
LLHGGRREQRLELGPERAPALRDLARMFQATRRMRTKGEIMEPWNSNEGKQTGTGGGIVDKAKEQATKQLLTQKDRATDGLGSLANTIRQSAQPLRDQQHDAVAQYVDQAADQLERLSATLRERELGELVKDAERFARRQPALFVGATFAAGFIAARFLKSSAEQAQRSQSYGSQSRAYDESSRFEERGFQGGV